MYLGLGLGLGLVWGRGRVSFFSSFRVRVRFWLGPDFVSAFRWSDGTRSFATVSVSVWA